MFYFAAASSPHYSLLPASVHNPAPHHPALSTQPNPYSQLFSPVTVTTPSTHHDPPAIHPHPPSLVRMNPTHSRIWQVR